MNPNNSNNASFERLSFDELQELHYRMSDFVGSYIAHTDNNRSAKLAAYGQCNTRGTHISAPIYGCNNVSTKIHDAVRREFGDQAQISTEIDPDGGGIHAFFQVPIYVPASAKKHAVASAKPTLATPLIWLLVDALLAGAFYYKITLGV